MNFTATQTLATEIPARAMLDLEPLGGEGFSDAYATFVAVDHATSTGRLHVLALHEGLLVALDVPADATIPVITYGDSNMLETLDR